MYNRILVPLDGSEMAEKILPHVKMLARCTGGEIVLLRTPVAIPASETLNAMAINPTPGALPPGYEHQEMVDETEGYLARVHDDLDKQGFQVRIVMAEGHPADQIVQVAQEENVDLIAMCTHGRTGLGRIVWGSVAEDVLHHSHRPVLLVCPHEQD
ncbi:MAG: universal stress protein [Anaerolineae bacterium]